ncbi:TolC family protein [Pelagibacteraceae bacterium]|jgi:outer membrane protein|nr:TolC family protein [Pelagibacteraceae bacterium]|tara:strand:- start:2060 stop:3370 length:1311 start_codon:yes stop_codon:yes gene_type:complete
MILNLINMKYIFIVLIIITNFSSAKTEEIMIFLESAYKNNPKLNAERKNLNATKQNINISRSEFLPTISVTGSIDGAQSTNRTNRSGADMIDTQNDAKTKKISIDQKIFQGLQGYNSLKKSELEVKKANSNLKKIEQETLLSAASAYFDLIYRIKNKKFNLENINLFERQVESDSARLQKGEITYTDLAQSESSLAGAKAKLIAAETKLLTTKANFERIIRIKAPNLDGNFNLNINLPNSLNETLELSKLNNPDLLVAKLDYEIAKRNLNIEKANFAPSASINYSKSESKDFNSTIDQVDQESVKATLSWPIIKGGKNYSSIKKSQFKRGQSELIFQDTTNEVKTNAANAWSIYQSSESVLNATQAQVKAAEIANEGITLEYDSGNTRTTLELIQSRTLLLDAKTSNAKAERDFFISKFKILSIIGKLTLDNIKNS